MAAPPPPSATCCGPSLPTGETHRWRDQQYVMRRCGACDLVFADPTVNPGAAFYESVGDYSDRVDSGKGTPLQPAQKLFLSRPPLGERLIELGCGTGEVLAAAREGGYDVVGLEFNSRFVEFCKKVRGIGHTLALTPDAFADKFPTEKFDVATFFEVLEHNHPADWMASVKRLLKPRGWIALSVPNRERTYETIREGDDPPHHLCRWTRASLRKFLDSQGFEVVELSAPVDRQNLAFQLREMTSLGLARKLTVDPGALVKPSTAAPPPTFKEAVLRGGVRLKERVLEAAAWPWYLRLVAFPGKYDGPNLFCLARLR